MRGSANRARIELRPMESSEWPQALELMRVNMLPLYAHHGIPWDPGWIEKHYLDKRNFIVESTEGMAGFLSVEELPAALYIHTFQLVPALQNGRVGMYVLRHLISMLREGQRDVLACSVFKDHPARQMYARMGFVEVAEQGNLIRLRWELARASAGLRRALVL